MPQPLDDAAIEAAIARRAEGRADARLLTSVLEAVRATPQVGPTILPDAIRSRRTLWAGLAAAALVSAMLAWSLGAGGIVTPSPTPGAPRASSVAIGPSPATSALATPERPCATETTTVATGAAMPPTETEPATMPDGVLDMAVYITRGDGDRAADVWALRSGAARRIASVDGSDFNRILINDLSADGSVAVLQVGEIHGGVPGPWCDDLYLLRTDGSGARRLTFNRADAHAQDGVLSPDGSSLAFRSSTASAGDELAVLDLDGSAPPMVLPCPGGIAPFGYAWGPTGDQLVVQCGQQVVLFADGATAGAVDLPIADDTVALRVGWGDSDTIVLWVEYGDVRAWTLSAAALRNDAGPTWIGPITTSPLIRSELQVESQALSPTGQALIVAGRLPTAQNSFALYVVHLATGTLTRVSEGTFGDVGWSRDGTRVILVEVNEATSQPTLFVVLTGGRNGSREAMGSLPVEELSGIWRGR